MEWCCYYVLLEFHMPTEYQQNINRITRECQRSINIVPFEYQQQRLPSQPCQRRLVFLFRKSRISPNLSQMPCVKKARGPSKPNVLKHFKRILKLKWTFRRFTTTFMLWGTFSPALEGVEAWCHSNFDLAAPPRPPL